MYLYERLQLPHMTFKTFFLYLEKYKQNVEPKITDYMNNYLTKVLAKHIISNLDTNNFKNATSVNPYFYMKGHDQLVLVEASISEEKLYESTLYIPPYTVPELGNYTIEFNFIHINSSNKILYYIDLSFIEIAIVEDKGLKNAFIKLAKNTIAKVFTNLLIRFSILKSVNTLDVEMKYFVSGGSKNKSTYSATFDLRGFTIKINDNCELELSMVETYPHFRLSVSGKQLMDVCVHQKDNQIMYNYFYRLLSNLK